MNEGVIDGVGVVLVVGVFVGVGQSTDVAWNNKLIPTYGFV